MTSNSLSGRRRGFRINLAIFLVVNVVLIVIAGGLLVAGYRFSGELWIYPVLMGLWALRVGFEGYRAYHGADGR